MVARCLVVMLLLAAPASAQMHPSLCGDCHFANGGAPNPQHLYQWDSSPHGRQNVGCESCHGGNPQTTESFPAHQSIVRGRGPDSPVNPRNLPRTCGRCHSGPFTQFQKSRHFTLLRNDDPAAPTCSTCHGEVSAFLLTPRALESECNSCHGRGKKFERPEYAANARILLQRVRDVRTLLETARPVIKRVKDRKLRSSLEYDYGQAEVPLIEAVNAVHAFVFDNTEERLGVARTRAEALNERLANPAAPRVPPR